MVVNTYNYLTLQTWKHKFFITLLNIHILILEKSKQQKLSAVDQTLFYCKKQLHQAC